MSGQSWVPYAMVLLLAWVQLVYAGSKEACGKIEEAVCECSNKQVNCSYRHLKDVPIHIPFTTRRLLLQGNDIGRVDKKSFDGLSSLNYLDLSNNKLDEGGISREVFDSVRNLKTLNLTGNKIKDISDGVFLHLTKLTSLILSNNKLENIRENDFAFLDSLVTLNLAKNKIKEVRDDAFRELPSLETLYLQENKLQEMDHKAFSNLSTLKILNLTGNQIAEIPAGAFYELPRMTNLYLSHNKLSKVAESFFTGYHDGVTLDLSFNQFTEVSKNIFNTRCGYSSLLLAYNKIEHLPPDLFSEILLTRTLDLSSNHLTELSPLLFKSSNGTHGLSTLFLQRNNLTTLEEDVFEGLPNLTYLCLFHNQIVYLAEAAFANTRVQYIYLFGNKFEKLSNSSFTNEHIMEVHLYGNPVKIVNETAFIGVNQEANLFLNCGTVKEIEQTNIGIKCVTPTYVPEIEVKKEFRWSFQSEGFVCSVDDEGDQAHCEPCPRGTYGNGANKCIPCPPGGYYQDSIGMKADGPRKMNCNECGNGTYVRSGNATSAGQCEVCPDGTDKTRHAGFRACFCMEEYARLNRFGPCEICLGHETGVNCTTGFDYKALRTGFYWNWTFDGANLTGYQRFVDNLKNETQFFSNLSDVTYEGEMPKVHKCPRKDSCPNTDSNTVDASCAKGHTGWLCTKCRSQFYSVMNSCMECPGWEFLLLEIAGISCILVLAFTGIFWQYQKEQLRQDDKRSIVDILISRGKIVLGFYQVIGEFFTSMHEVNWAGKLYVIGEFINYLELNILRIFVRPQCFDEKLHMDPKIEFIVGMVFPTAIILMSGVFYYLRMAYFRYRQRGQIDFDGKMSFQERLKSKVLTFIIVLLFVTYPPICTIIFQLYPGACEKFCYDVGEKTCMTVLRSDYEIDCDNKLIPYQYSAFVATFIYVFGFPVILLYLLWKHSPRKTPPSPPRDTMIQETTNREDQEDDEDDEEEEQELIPLLRYEPRRPTRTIPTWLYSLCENYQSKFWYWEIVELTRKVTQTVLITLLGWEDKLTVLLTIGISVLFLTLHARYMPMKSKFEQRLQMFSLTAILINVLVAAMEVPDEYGDAFATALILLNVVVILIIAVEALVGLFHFLKISRVHVHIKQGVTVPFRWLMARTRRNSKGRE